MSENESLPPSPPESSAPPPPSPPSSGAGMTQGDERTWALLAHLSTFSGFITGIGVVVGPLLVWLLKRNESAFVDDQGKEALNFNITVLLAGLALLVVAVFTFGLGLLLAVPGWIVLFFWWLILSIIAAINANNGERYRYPLTLRLIT